MVKMSGPGSGSSGRKRLAPTKVTAGGKMKSSKGPSPSPGIADGNGFDSFTLRIKGGGSGNGSGYSSADPDENHDHEEPQPGKAHAHSKHGHESGSKIMKSESPAVDWFGGYHPIGAPPPAATTANNNNVFANGKHEARKQSSPLTLGSGHQDESSSNGNRDEQDEEDDDEDSLDKADGSAHHRHDPERLKAFNMFVRLFVDENLDRMVPISKQPKEKIQAIIDSCTRQFPEYAERARKRIRTYLKSCRRNKRIKDGPGGGVGAGWESTRPTPAHLTSAQAEQILAQACENESQNAKRMRMGLEPISQPIPSAGNARLTSENGCPAPPSSRSSSSLTPSSPEKLLKLSNNGACSGPASTPMPSPSTTAATISAVVAAAVAANHSTCSSLSSPSSGISSLSAFSESNASPTTHAHGNGAPPHIGHLANGSSSPSSLDGPLLNCTSMSGLSKLVGAERGNHVVDYSRRLNGSAGSVSMYKPNFCQALSKPGQFPGSLFSPVVNGALNGLIGDAGPTDLSMKVKSPPSTASAATLLTQHLNLTELATVRQLIIGYRESAAFLLRSADELEQLLQQQQ